MVLLMGNWSVGTKDYSKVLLKVIHLVEIWAAH